MSVPTPPPTPSGTPAPPNVTEPLFQPVASPDTSLGCGGIGCGALAVVLIGVLVILLVVFGLRYAHKKRNENAKKGFQQEEKKKRQQELSKPMWSPKGSEAGGDKNSIEMSDQASVRNSPRPSLGQALTTASSSTYSNGSVSPQATRLVDLEQPRLTRTMSKFSDTGSIRSSSPRGQSALKNPIGMTDGPVRNVSFSIGPGDKAHSAAADAATVRTADSASPMASPRGSALKKSNSGIQFGRRSEPTVFAGEL